MKEGFIFGCGAQGRVALDILRLQYPKTNWSFIDEDAKLLNHVINGATVIGGFDVLKNKESRNLHIALGKPSVKQKIAEKCVELNIDLINAIHPSAIILPTATIGKGVMIGAGAIVNTDAKIGNCVLINTQSVIEHDTVVGDYSNISPAACIGGRVNIGERVFIGSGSIVLARISIEKNSIIGMGTVVTKNIPEYTLSYGVPAKVIKKIDENFDWSRVL